MGRLSVSDLLIHFLKWVGLDNDVVCVPTDSALYADVSPYLSQGIWQTLVEIFEDNWMVYLTALGFSYVLA